MSGGSYDYLADRASAGILIPVDDNLLRMAERLEATPGAERAAADTRAVIAAVEGAQEAAARLYDVWRAVEWADSCDWSEEDVAEAVAKYVQVVE